ncbi:MAG: hypothetical protein H6842_16005 [Rhodospirillaceae bacterium]|nr:hypothetical protein [Rhodospirillaceae bacterium]
MRQQMELGGRSFPFVALDTSRSGWHGRPAGWAPPASNDWHPVPTAEGSDARLAAVARPDGGTDDLPEPRRRTDDRILDLVETLPRPAKIVVPLIGALLAVVLLLPPAGVMPDSQGMAQLAMTAVLGSLVGHVIQCCGVGALLLATRVFAAGPAILKGLLLIGAIAGFAHLFGSPIL